MICLKTRMHSSRMHTAHSSSRLGRGSQPGTPPEQAPSKAGTPLGPGTPLEQAPPGAGTPPQAGPLTRSPSTSPLAVGLDQIPLHFPLGCGPGDPSWTPAARHAGIPPALHAGIPPPGDLLQGMLGYHLQCMLG